MRWPRREDQSVDGGKGKAAHYETRSRRPTSDIRDAIVSGSFLPNERLIEEDLVKRFSANRGTVRLAIARLEQEGLVVRAANRGARVRLLSPKEALEITEARAVLEALAARHAAAKIKPEQVCALRKKLKQLKSLLAAGDLIAYSSENMDLHRMIVEIADHQTIARLLSSLRAQSVIAQFRPFLEPGRAEALLREHEEIVDVLAARGSEQSRTRHAHAPRPLHDDHRQPLAADGRHHARLADEFALLSLRVTGAGPVPAPARSAPLSPGQTARACFAVLRNFSLAGRVATSRTNAMLRRVCSNSSPRSVPSTSLT